MFEFRERIWGKFEIKFRQIHAELSIRENFLR